MFSFLPFIFDRSYIGFSTSNFIYTPLIPLYFFSSFFLSESCIFFFKNLSHYDICLFICSSLFFSHVDVYTRLVYFLLLRVVFKNSGVTISSLWRWFLFTSMYSFPVFFIYISFFHKLYSLLKAVHAIIPVKCSRHSNN